VIGLFVLISWIVHEDPAARAAVDRALTWNPPAPLSPRALLDERKAEVERERFSEVAISAPVILDGLPEGYTAQPNRFRASIDFGDVTIESTGEGTDVSGAVAGL
jgi:hypothetical protein